MPKRANFPVILTRTLFAGVAGSWATVAILVLADVVEIGPVERQSAVVLAALMLANAGVMAFLAWRVLRGRKLIDYGAVAIVVLNVAATFTDDVGAIDLAYFAFSVALLGCLLWSIGVGRYADGT